MTTEEDLFPRQTEVVGNLSAYLTKSQLRVPNPQHHFTSIAMHNELIRLPLLQINPTQKSIIQSYSLQLLKIYTYDSTYLVRTCEHIYSI